MKIDACYKSFPRPSPQFLQKSAFFRTKNSNDCSSYRSSRYQRALTVHSECADLRFMRLNYAFDTFLNNYIHQSAYLLYVRIFNPPFSVCRQTIVFYIGFSAVLMPQRPSGFMQVSIYSISFRVSKLKTNILSSSTTTSMSFLSLILLISLLLLNVISVLFFFSWSSHITTLFFYFENTITIIFVLYIISMSSTLSPVT